MRSYQQVGEMQQMIKGYIVKGNRENQRRKLHNTSCWFIYTLYEDMIVSIEMKNPFGNFMNKKSNKLIIWS